jgi:hypothetical protein
MDAQHTEGPWAIVDKGYGVNIEPSIAWIGFGSAHSTTEHKANARLIAAAPDLLEALDTLTLVIGLTPIAGNKEALQEAFNIARAAIAAAEGRAE